MGDTFGQLKDMLPFLVPVILLQVVLLVISLVDIVRRRAVTGGSKLLWILIVCLVNVIGPVVYLAMGRKEQAYDGD